MILSRTDTGAEGNFDEADLCSEDLAFLCGDVVTCRYYRELQFWHAWSTFIANCNISYSETMHLKLSMDHNYCNFK